MKKLIAGVLLAAALPLAGCSYMNQQTHENCLVEAKNTEYNMTDGNSSRKNRLVTSCGVFEVGDSLNGGFSSYTTWSSLKEGKRYDIKTGGYRVGFTSSFPTVLEVREVK